MRLRQAHDIIVKIPGPDRSAGGPARPLCFIAGDNAADLERHDLVVETAQHRLQRAHPGQIAPIPIRIAPAHRLRPRKIPHDVGDRLGDDCRCQAPRPVKTGDVILTLFVFLDRALIERGEPRRLQKTVDRPLWRANARALFLLLAVRLAQAKSRCKQRQAPGPGKGLHRLGQEPRRKKALVHHPLQIVGRALLHARRDFFGEKFKEKIGHWRDLGIGNGE